MTLKLSNATGVAGLANPTTAILDLSVNKVFWYLTNCFYCIKSYLRTSLIIKENDKCTYSILPTNRTHTGFAETSSVTVVTSHTICQWTAKSNTTWVTITSGNSGTGTGTVTYNIITNSTTNVRSGTMTIAGKTFTIFQSSNVKLDDVIVDFGTGTGVNAWMNNK